MTVEPIEPAYLLPGIGEPLVAYEGDAQMPNGDLLALRVWAPLRHSAKLHWTAEGDRDWSLGVEVATLLDGPHAGMTADLWVHSTRGTGTISEAEIATDQALSRVVAHWINVPPIHVLDLIEDDRSRWRGRLLVEARSWTLTLDARYDIFEIDRKMMSDVDEFVVSYVSELRRSDGLGFSSAEAVAAMEAFDHAMSFVLGRWVAPAFPVGYGADGHRCWEQWTAWRCDRLHGYESWAPKFKADDIRDFVQRFVEHYLEPDDHPVVRHVARHVLAANTTRSTLEARLMIAQAALEYLGWVDLVLGGRLSKTEYKALSAAARLRLLLQAASIPASVPDGLDSLTKSPTDPGEEDGPGRTAWVRNRVVHPKDADEPYRIDDLVWHASVLTIEYVELLLLHRIGYGGHYARRYPPGRNAGEHHPVPWASESEAKGPR